MQIEPNTRNSGSLLKLGLKILSLSYKTLQAEKLRNSHAPSNSMRTAWPSIFIEFSDLVEGAATPPRTYYTPEEIRNANEICEIFSKLPYNRQEKRITLVKARQGKSWRELSTQFGLPWEECRRICDIIILHLVQAAAMDKYKEKARQSRNRINSKAQIYQVFEKE